MSAPISTSRTVSVKNAQTKSLRSKRPVLHETQDKGIASFGSSPFERSKIQQEIVRRTQELMMREDALAHREEALAHRELVVAMKELEHREEVLAIREESLVRREKDLTRREAALQHHQHHHHHHDHELTLADPSPAETLGDLDPVDMASSKLFEKTHTSSTLTSASPTSPSSEVAEFESNGAVRKLTKALLHKLGAESATIESQHAHAVMA